MSYLSRENAPIGSDLWKKIDSEVISAARSALTGRKFLHIYGPLGIGAESIRVDDSKSADEAEADGLITTKGRSYVQIPTLYEDFTLLAKDLESDGKTGYPTDLSGVAYAAETCARKEDRLIFFGSEANGYEGLLTASGIHRIKRSDWAADENAFSDLAAGLEWFTANGIYGAYALIVSPDLYLKLQRIQPGTGLLEIERISRLLKGNVFTSPVLGAEKAVLVCSEPRYMDLVIGQDLATAYLEQNNLNHRFRVLETVLPRIRRKEAVVAFE